jgi:hypothetical protein
MNDPFDPMRATESSAIGVSTPTTGEVIAGPWRNGGAHRGIGDNNGPALTSSSSSSAATLEVVLDQRDTLHRQQLFNTILTEWSKAEQAKRNQEALDRRLPEEDRLRVHRLAHLEGLSRYYRTHPLAEVAPGLFSVIVMLSDNEDGACYLSLARIAKLLSRSIDSIRGARRRLVEEGIIGFEVRAEDGETNLYWPLAHPSFLEDASPLWVINALAPARKGGRPRNPLPSTTQGVSENPLPSTTQGVSPKMPKTPWCLPPTPGAYAQKPPGVYHPPNSSNIDSTNDTAASDEAADTTEKPKKRRTQLPPDWRPSHRMLDWVRAGWVATERQIEDQLAQFRDHHRGKGSLMLDWDAAWRTWWRNGYHKIPRRQSEVGLDDEVRAAAASDAGQKMLARFGPDEGMRKIRDHVANKRKGR